MSDQSLILIVDDEPSGRQNLAALLEPEGYRLAFATNGQEALDQAGRLTPDLILLDLMMPGMDGYEVCRQLRATPRLAEAPIFMVTALDDRPSRLRGLETGVDDFITKPFDRTELRARIRTTTRLNRYRRLLEERARTEQIIALAPDGIVLLDERLQVRLANEAMREMTRAESLDDLTNLGLASLLAQTGRAAVLARLKEMLASGGRPVELATVFNRLDGSQFPVELAAAGFPWENGLGLQLNVRDATEKQRFQRELLRTQRLQSIGTLAGGIGHDLNNCLTPVLAAAQLLHAEVKSETGQALLQAAEQAARRGAGILRQLLMFARGAEEGKQPVHLKLLVEELRLLVTRTFPPSIQFTARLAPGLRAVRGDVTQLHQVLMNLCVNARDAMPQGGRLAVEAQTVAVTGEFAGKPAGVAPGTFVLVSVSDTGTGIPPEVMEHMFEPFYSTKPAGHGTGLGLYSVLTVVENHGGFVRVDSTPGAGSQFQIYLPVTEPAEAPGEITAPASLPIAKGELILVVDDDEAIRQVCAAALRRQGYRTLLAPEGATATGLLATHRGEISLALVDASMPLLDGPATLQALSVLNPSLRTVVMCAWNERAPFEQSGLRPKPALLAKPFALETLLATVRDALRESAPRHD